MDKTSIYPLFVGRKEGNTFGSFTESQGFKIIENLPGVC